MARRAFLEHEVNGRVYKNVYENIGFKGPVPIMHKVRQLSFSLLILKISHVHAHVWISKRFALMMHTVGFVVVVRSLWPLSAHAIRPDLNASFIILCFLLRTGGNREDKNEVYDGRIQPRHLPFHAIGSNGNVADRAGGLA